MCRRRCSTARASPASRPTLKVHARSADARVLPGRRHLVRQRRRPAPVKFGVQFDRVGNNVLSGEARPRVTLRWGLARLERRRQQGTYGYYSVRSNARIRSRLHHRGQRPHEQPRPVHPGRLDDRQQAHGQPRHPHRARARADLRPGADYPRRFGIEFGFKSDKLAPRAGFAYDLKGDGKWKLFGSWGVFYDIFKLELPRGSFGGDKWIEYYYTLDTYDCNSLVPARLPAGVPGRLHPRRPTSVTRRSGRTRSQPGLKPMTQQERRSASITSSRRSWR